MNAFAPARDAADRAAVRHARRIAFRLSLGFLVLCSLYILFSSRLAPRWFPSLEEVAAFEVLKGLAFMVTISVIFYAFASRLLARNALQQEELRRQQEALELSGRRATAGLVASTVAHDMNNVLTVALLHLEALAKADPEAVAEGRMRLQRALDDLAKQARRLAALGQGVGPSSAGPAVPLDLCALAGTVLDFARHHPDLRGCHVLLKDREPARLRGQPRLLGHLLLNLLLNAGAATRGCGRIEIRCRPEPEGGVTLEVHDDGPGMSDEVRQRLGEPFVTTRPGGLGLGLVSVKAAAEAHGGRLEVDRSPLGGACLRVRLRDAGPEA